MQYTYLPESSTIVMARVIKESPRANKILEALISQTSQVEYDNITVDQLIREYEKLVSE